MLHLLTLMSLIAQARGPEKRATHASARATRRAAGRRFGNPFLTMTICVPRNETV